MVRNRLQLSDFVPKKPPKIQLQGTAKLDRIITFGSISDNLSGVESLIQKAIKEGTMNAVKDLKLALDNAIRSGVWDGLQGNSDIYDTGELLSSGEVVADGSGIRVFYTAPYASLVHYGGYINPYGNINARVYLPPRPWVESVVSGGGPVPQFDFGRYYQEALDRAFG